MKIANRVLICLLAVCMLLMPVACKGKARRVIGTAAAAAVRLRRDLRQIAA